MAETEAWFKNKLAINKLGYPCLTYSKALEYIEDGFSCLSEVESQRQIGLPPRYIGKVNVGIRETLEADLLKYSEELCGIIVCYKQVKCMNTSGSIMDETPFLYFVVNVKYIVFRPQVGVKLKGIVNRVGYGHYGCIVHECFNASVHKIKTDAINLPKKVMKRILGIDVGTELVFRITRFDIRNDILSIKGKIDNEDLQKIRNQRKDASLTEQVVKVEIEESKIDESPSSKKVKKENNLENGMSQNQTEVQIKEEKEIGENLKIRKEKLKKNKRRHSEVMKIIKLENDTEEKGINSVETTVVKKKKKVKH